MPQMRFFREGLRSTVNINLAIGVFINHLKWSRPRIRTPLQTYEEIEPPGNLDLERNLAIG